MNETKQCSFCRQEFSKTNLILFDDVLLCSECLEEQTTICHDCGKRIWNTDAIEYSGYDYCTSCYDDRFTTCERCGTVIYFDDANYYADDEDHDAPYCDSCYHEKEHSIHSYQFKPEPIFYGSGLFMGVELEVDKGGENYDHASDILKIANQNFPHIYIKRDGSIDDGFELVTHPMSLEYHMTEMPWPETLKQAIKLRYHSHQTTTCGLHVHCSRAALGETADQQEAVIARLLFFIEKHWNEMLKFSRRTEYQINRWASRYGFKDSPGEVMKNAKDARLGRYVCVNLENYNTIEFRIFRGTLRYETFIATLQMVDEICNTAISSTDKKFQSMTWNSFVSKIPKCKIELINYLKEKQLYVNTKVTGRGEI